MGGCLGKEDSVNIEEKEKKNLKTDSSREESSFEKDLMAIVQDNPQSLENAILKEILRNKKDLKEMGYERSKYVENLVVPRNMSIFNSY